MLTFSYELQRTYIGDPQATIRIKSLSARVQACKQVEPATLNRPRHLVLIIVARQALGMLPVL